MGSAIGIGYYQLYYVPEYNAKPIIPKKIRDSGQTKITIVVGSVNQDQNQNFVPKKMEAQLGVDNLVVWTNHDLLHIMSFLTRHTMMLIEKLVLMQ